MSVLLLLALAMRLAWGLMQPREIDSRLPDQQEYLQLGRNLLAGQGLKFQDPRFGQWIHAYRTPGYPMFLAACGGSVTAARVAQALLDTSTVLAVYLLGRRWLEHGPAITGAALVALNPFLVYFSGLLLSETLFTAMLAWGMVLLAWRPSYLAGGMVLALSVLVRPSALALPVLLGMAAVFVTHHPGGYDRPSWLRLPVGATMLLLVLIVLTPWALRNHAVLGRWVWLTTNGGITRYDGFNPDATGGSDQKFLQELEMRDVVRMGEVERNQHFSNLADRSIQEAWAKRPLWLAKLTSLKIIRTWSPVPLSDEFGRPLYRLVALLFAIPLDALLVWGLWAGRLPRAAKVFLLLPAVYFTAVHALSVGSLRYRVPAEPPLTVLAAAGAAALASLIWRPAWRRATSA